MCCISLLGLLSQSATDWPKQQKLLFLQFWTLDVQDQRLVSSEISLFCW